MNKRDLSERDICSKYITPALETAGWDRMLQIREEVSFTRGRIIVRGKLVSRGRAKRADYMLQYKKNIPIAVIEAKDNSHSLGDPHVLSIPPINNIGTLMQLVNAFSGRPGFEQAVHELQDALYEQLA